MPTVPPVSIPAAQEGAGGGGAASPGTPGADGGDVPADQFRPRGHREASVRVRRDAGGYDAYRNGVEFDEGTFLLYDSPTSEGLSFVGIASGFVIRYAGASAPDGWLACDGAAVSRATYALLFAAIGTAYGVGDGSTTFNLPNVAGTPLTVIKT